jgi:hypothetical protein
MIDADSVDPMPGGMSDDESQQSHLRDRLLTLNDLAKLPPSKPLIDGLIYRNTLAQLSGGPGTYKTFLALTMGCCVATGETFGDFDVPKQGTVIYVAAEGASDIEKRILAWCEVWEINPDTLLDRVFVLPLPIQLGKDTDISQIIEVVQEKKADLLVLDTRARCTLGMNENDATEQGWAIHAAERIRMVGGCAVLVVHHTPRSGSAGRGSNAWDGAIWSDLRVEGDGLHAKIHCEKHKDVASNCDHHFSLQTHTVSKDLMPRTILDKERETLVTSRRLPDLARRRTSARQKILNLIWTIAPPEGFAEPSLREMADCSRTSKRVRRHELGR